MNMIKDWIFIVCGAAIIGGFAEVIAPAGKLNNILKFFISLMVLSCVLYPLRFVGNELKEIKTIKSREFSEEINTTNIDKALKQEIEESIRVSLQEYIEKTLNDSIKVLKIYTLKDELDNMNVIRVDIKGDRNNDRVKKLIYEQLGQDVEINFY